VAVLFIQVVSSSLLEGDAYGRPPRVVGLFLLDDVYFPNLEDGCNGSQMCRTSQPGKWRLALTTGLPSLQFVDLGKLRSSGTSADPILRSWVDFVLPASSEEWENVESENAMFSDLKKKVETFSADHELAIRQRAIDEGRMGRQIELGGAYCVHPLLCWPEGVL
jgi:hypothetical protein